MFSSKKQTNGEHKKVRGARFKANMAGLQTTSSSTMDFMQGTLNASSCDEVKGRTDKHL